MDWWAVLGSIGFWAPVTIYAVWHASRQPDERWAAIGENKTLWIVVMTAGQFIAGLGFFAALWYLASLRLQLEKAGAPAPPQTRPA